MCSTSLSLAPEQIINGQPALASNRLHGGTQLRPLIFSPPSHPRRLPALLDHGGVDVPRLGLVVVNPHAEDLLAPPSGAVVLDPHDDELVHDLDVAHARQVDDEVLQPAAAEYEDAQPRALGRVVGEGPLGADEHGALDAGLVPALLGGREGVDDGAGGDAEDGADGGEVALEDGEVELGVCPRGGRRRVVVLGLHLGGVGLVVGDGGDAVGGVAVVP